MSYDQYALRFQAQDSYQATDYFMTPSVHPILKLMQTCSGVFYIQGPPSSGKSHLSHVFCEMRHGHYYHAEEIHNLESLKFDSPLAIDDCEKTSTAELLFHIMNKAKECNQPLLLTSRQTIPEFQFQLPDLISRLRSGLYESIPKPDDMLIRGILLKRFSDHQIRFQGDVLDYIVVRIPREYSYLDRFFHELIKYLHHFPRNLTLPVIREVLTTLEHD